MPTHSTFPEMDQWYMEGLALFVERIDGALENRDDAEEFREILNWAFRLFDMSASELHADLRISKAAVSKWTNGHATTSAPTQRAVLEWVRERAVGQMAMIATKDVADTVAPRI